MCASRDYNQARSVCAGEPGPSKLKKASSASKEPTANARGRPSKAKAEKKDGGKATAKDGKALKGGGKKAAEAAVVANGGEEAHKPKKLKLKIKRKEPQD